VSSTTRVYVPVTRAQLADLVEVGKLVGPRSAHAVTPRFRASWPGVDEEELEYAALGAAAQASWRMRGSGNPARRHVIAADVPLEDSGAGEVATAVVIGDVSLPNVASLHVDLQDVTDLEDDLAWFAPQELADLLQSE
jgi:hypothetical protein